MTVFEIIKSLESEKNKLKIENKKLKDKVIKLIAERNKIDRELKSLKSLLFENEHDEKKVEIVTVVKEVPVEKPIVEEVEKQVTSIVTNVDGKVNASIVEGESISIDDVVEAPAKPKRSRKKKVDETPIFVEPVEEPIENV